MAGTTDSTSAGTTGTGIDTPSETGLSESTTEQKDNPLKNTANPWKPLSAKFNQNSITIRKFENLKSGGSDNISSIHSWHINPTTMTYCKQLHTSIWNFCQLLEKVFGGPTTMGVEHFSFFCFHLFSVWPTSFPFPFVSKDLTC